VGVGVAFGLTGNWAGFSAGNVGFSWEKETCALRDAMAPRTINLRRSMKDESAAKNLGLLSRRDLQRKPSARARAGGGQKRARKRIQSLVRFPDIIRNLGSYPAETRGMTHSA